MSVGLPAQRHYLGTGPLDSRTWFNTLEEARNNIPGDRRFKGQKFTVRNVIENEGTPEETNRGPIEYWFVKDYVAAGEDWVEDPDGVDPDDPNYPWRPDPPEFIPDLENGGLVLYQPGGGELPPLSGETIMASLDPNFPYKSFYCESVFP